jgi:Na+-transporting NADH:ubiquinone oxidoreductase subunit NqrD
MSESPEPKRPQPKLFKRGKFFLPFIAILFGASLLIIREYCAKGNVSGLTIAASVAAFVIGLIILLVMGWYANKPER